MISVIIPSVKAEVETLRSLDVLAYPHEVIVARERGVGFARNCGARRAKGEVLLFVDDDLRLDKRINDYVKVSPGCFGMTLQRGEACTRIFIIRTEDFWFVGGFDQFYTGTNEDKDFFLRASRHLRFMRVPDSVYVHSEHPNRAKGNFYGGLRWVKEEVYCFLTYGWRDVNSRLNLVKRLWVQPRTGGFTWLCLMAYLPFHLIRNLLRKWDCLMRKFMAGLYGFAMKSFELNRYAFYRKKYRIAKSFSFSGNGTVFCGDGLIVCGEESYIGAGGYIKAVVGTRVTIGRKCRIGSGLDVHTASTHADQDFNSDRLGSRRADVKIGNFCWVGDSVFIREGVTLGDNCVVGAGSVVTRSFPSNSVIAGSPAKLLRRKIIK